MATYNISRYIGTPDIVDMYVGGRDRSEAVPPRPPPEMQAMLEEGGTLLCCSADNGPLPVTIIMQALDQHPSNLSRPGGLGRIPGACAPGGITVKGKGGVSSIRGGTRQCGPRREHRRSTQTTSARYG